MPRVIKQGLGACGAGCWGGGTSRVSKVVTPVQAWAETKRIGGKPEKGRLLGAMPVSIKSAVSCASDSHPSNQLTYSLLPLLLILDRFRTENANKWQITVFSLII